MASSYVPLRLRSNHSLLTGTAGIRAIIERAKQYGLPALALTDVNNLYGAIPFYEQAREAGLKPILGVDLVHTSGRATVLAGDRTGYANLCRLVTLCHLDDAFDLAEALIAHQDGLFILGESLSLLLNLTGRIAPERLWAELVRPGRSRMQQDRLVSEARRLGIGIVATGDVYFLDPEDMPLHRVLTAIRQNQLVSETPLDGVAHPEAFFAPPSEMWQRYRDCPEALTATRTIAEACHLELSLGQPIFPRYAVPNGQTAASHLQQSCRAGLPRRYDPVPEAAVTRLAYELDIIHRLGFDDYFLVVGDIVRFARSRGIPVVGRGSGASSIVAYLLGITRVDPLKYHLPFERFLNIHRTDCPDLDIDFCWKQRDTVIDHVYRTYGADRVAMISTHTTFQQRNALREVAKAFGLSNHQITTLGRWFPRDGRPMRAWLPHCAALASLSPDSLQAMGTFAEKIVGLPHHLGIHCGGIVIGDRALTHYVPLEQATKGIVVTQFEMDAIERAGLVKIDLLGNRALSTIRDTVTLLEAQAGLSVDVEALPDRDPATLHRIRTAQTLGCCQLESPAMRRLLTMLRPESVHRIIQALALIRPAPSAIGMQAAFVRRARGLEPTHFLHPSLEDILGDTFGILLYEDDAMLIANRIAGLSIEAGDRFRKAIKKSRTREDFLSTWAFFRLHTRRNGVPDEIARQIWIQMAKFNEYSFCRAHAAGYGLVAYQGAFLKTHFPAAYMVAALNNVQGLYPRRVHLGEARRMGIPIRLPHVNASQSAFTLEGDAIRIGLEQIKGLSQQTIATLLSQREQTPFVSIADFLGRVPCGLNELEGLILAGCFDRMDWNRAQLLWQAHAHFGKVKARSTENLLLHCEPQAIAPPPLPDHTLAQRVDYELAILECPVSAHPVDLARRQLNGNGSSFATSHDLPGRVGRRVSLLGIQDAARTVATRNGQAMRFVTFEDETGLFEVCLFPDAYHRLRGRLNDLGPYTIEGTVEAQYDAITITAGEIRRFAE